MYIYIYIYVYIYIYISTKLYIKMKLALISMLVDYHQKNLHVIATSYYSQTLTFSNTRL